MEKPTRVIEMPKYASIDKHTKLMIKCDDGNVYTARELAEVVGISYNLLMSRACRFGWTNEKTFLPISEKAVKMRKNSRKQLSDGENIGGNDEWKRLRIRPRTENLSRLPAVTRCERELFG